MSDEIRIRKVDEVWLEIDTDESIRHELSDHFCFDVPGAAFMKKRNPKLKNWDGKIRLFNLRDNTVYVGLFNRIEQFAEERGYMVRTDFDVGSEPDEDILRDIYNSIDKESLNQEQLNIQLKTFLYCVKNDRAVIESPTASGKSFIIYLLCLYYLKYLESPKILIIVPTTTLVSQMGGDLIEYGMPEEIRQITAGEEKQGNEPVTISTWQSIYKLDKNYFSQYDVMIGDECHLYEAKSIAGILEKMKNTRYRFGLTGTLKESKTNEMSLNGLFGPIKRFVKTKELIEMDVLSDIQIYNIVLKYSEKERRELADRYKTYQEEMDYIVSHEKRLKYIAKLAGSFEGNTLVLYTLVEKHGGPLYDKIVEYYDPEKTVHLIHGGVNKEWRNEIRSVCEETNDNIVVASYGTYSTGINIRNLHTIIFASPYKSKIKVMQSIGRGLRKHESKDSLRLIDIVDDLKHNDRMNHTLKHFVERVRMYNEERLDYNMHNVELQS